jgi:phosphate transport system permease protein
MIRRRKIQDSLFAISGLLAMLIGSAMLLALLIGLAIDGAGRLDWQFFTSYPSRFPDKAGILTAWIGTILVMFVTAVSAVPLGIAAAVYLEEYAPKNWMTDLIEINIANLAGVPSIVYGLMALGLFVYQFNLGHSILTAGLTLALLILPMVIIATGEAPAAFPTVSVKPRMR